MVGLFFLLARERKETSYQSKPPKARKRPQKLEGISVAAVLYLERSLSSLVRRRERGRRKYKAFPRAIGREERLWLSPRQIVVVATARKGFLLRLT